MPPYALFPAFQLKIETINDLLAKTDLFDCQFFWLITSTDYSELPTSYKEGIPTREYPVAPFQYPFIGNNLAELSAFLKSAPEQVVLDRTFFAVMDERTEKDGSILCCMAEKDDGGKVLSFRHSADGGAMFLASTSTIEFIEAMERPHGPDLIEEGD